MDSEQTTKEQEPKEPKAKKEPKAEEGSAPEKQQAVPKRNKLICKGPREVSVHIIDPEFEESLSDAEKVGAGSVKGKVLLPGQYVDTSEVPDYIVTDEIRNGESDLLELVTAQEASIYKPTPEPEFVSVGMEVPNNNFLGRT